MTRGAIRVQRVEAIPLRCALPPQTQHVSDFGRITRFDMVLVVVELSGGIRGYGEAKAAVGSAGETAAICASIEHDLAPLIVGEDAGNVVALWERMYSGPRAAHAVGAGRPMPALDRRGTRLSAMSGIDMALWDALGKYYELPVYQLLGGRCRDRVPLYASGGWAGPEAIGEELLSYRDRGGFRAFKMRVGVMDGDVDRAVARTVAAREALGPGLKLMADAHGTFTVPEAKHFCRRIAQAQVGLTWLEEPVSVEDPIGMAEVRRDTDVPIAAGESESSRFAFRDLLAAGAIDVLQPDLAICGGITEGHRIATLGGVYLKAVAPHSWGSALLFAAGLHLAAACLNVTVLEYPMGGNPMLRELPKSPFTVEDGTTAVPDAPGLGVTVCEQFVAAHRLDKREVAS